MFGVGYGVLGFVRFGLKGVLAHRLCIPSIPMNGERTYVATLRRRTESGLQLGFRFLYVVTGAWVCRSRP